MSDESGADAIAAEVPTGGRPRAIAEFWHYFSVNKGAVLGLVVFGVLVLISSLAPLSLPNPPS